MESSKRCVLLPDLLGNQSFDANSQQPYQTNIIVICGVTDRTNYIYIYNRFDLYSVFLVQIHSEPRSSRIDKYVLWLWGLTVLHRAVEVMTRQLNTR